MEIDITGVDLTKFVKEVYRLSISAGLGRLRFRGGGLTDKEAVEILDICKSDPELCLDMDYVRGRACKMTVFRGRNRIYMRSPWHDHTDMRLKMLLNAVWPKDKTFPELKAEEHGIACHCMHCQIKRRIQV